MAFPSAANDGSVLVCKWKAGGEPDAEIEPKRDGGKGEGEGAPHPGPVGRAVEQAMRGARPHQGGAGPAER